jgi:hypothetical protein
MEKAILPKDTAYLGSWNGSLQADKGFFLVDPCTFSLESIESLPVECRGFSQRLDETGGWTRR